MAWKLSDALAYYQRQGAPADQSALIALLSELQQAYGGSIPKHLLGSIADSYAIKESLLLALIRRIPRLRLSDTHTLELCAGPNCGKCTAVAACAEKLRSSNPGKIDLKYVPCMRLCGKGPNIRWDGTLYHQADEVLLIQLAKDI